MNSPRPAGDQAGLAALHALLASTSEPVTVAVHALDGRHLLTVTLQPSPAFAQQPTAARDDDERDCRVDILAVLRESGRRLTTTQILAELERHRWLWGEATVKRHLAAMVQEGALDNETSARPPGYRAIPR